MTFLNVDDSATMRKIVTLALTGGGHNSTEAENGQQALDALKKAPVDCVILDINMPVMGGIDFLKARKADAGLSKIPVIVLTTQDDQALKDEAMALGAAAFVVKPFQKEDILATIKKVLG